MRMLDWNQLELTNLVIPTQIVFRIQKWKFGVNPTRSRHCDKYIVL